MNFLKYCLSLVLAQAALFAHAQTEYFLTDVDQARAQSQATGKPILLDAFTTWCKPCRQMDLKVFSDPEVEALLVAQFVPLRLDMEQAAGQRLGERFGIRAYPTLVIFDDAGEIHRGTGYMDVSAVAAFAKTSLDPTRNVRGLRARYARGDRAPELLHELEAIAAQGESTDYEVYAYDYLRATGDWDSEAAGERLLRALQTTETPLFDSLVARQLQLQRQFSVPVVEERINRLVDASLFPEEGLSAKPRAAKRILRRAYGPAADSAYHRFRMRRAREAGKAKAFGKWAVRTQKKYPTSDPDELSELVYVFDERLPGYKAATVESWRQRERALREERGW